MYQFIYSRDLFSFKAEQAILIDSTLPLRKLHLLDVFLRFSKKIIRNEFLTKGPIQYI